MFIFNCRVALREIKQTGEQQVVLDCSHARYTACYLMNTYSMYII